MQGTVIAIPADTHCGSTVGLMTREQWQGKSGYHSPTPAQRIIRRQYEECLNRVAQLRKGKDLIIVHDGDAVDGYHHDTTQVITNDPEEQERIHISIMLEMMKAVHFKDTDSIYYVEGTTAHVRSGAQAEERIARDISAKPYRKNSAPGQKDGIYVWPRLILDIHGIRLDIAHHGGAVGKRAWLRENTMRNILKSLYFDCLNYKQPLPRYWIRADKHQHVADIYRNNAGIIEGIVTPAFQLRTEYSTRIAGDMSMSTIGMLIVVVNADGSTFWECPQITFDETEGFEVTK